jgi:hypothetical protein
MGSPNPTTTIGLSAARRTANAPFAPPVTNTSAPRFQEIRDQLRQTIRSTCRPALLDPDGLAVDIAVLPHTLPKGIRPLVDRSRDLNEADDRYSSCLRLGAGGERPCYCRAAKQPNEIGPSHPPAGSHGAHALFRLVISLGPPRGVVLRSAAPASRIARGASFPNRLGGDRTAAALTDGR